MTGTNGDPLIFPSLNLSVYTFHFPLSLFLNSRTNRRQPNKKHYKYIFLIPFSKNKTFQNEREKILLKLADLFSILNII